MRLKISKKFVVIGFLIAVSIFGYEVFRAYKSAQNSLSEERARLLYDKSVAFIKTRLTPYPERDVRILQNVSDTRSIIKYRNSYFAATGGGLVQYAPDGEIVKHFTVLDGLPESDLTALAVFGEKLYVGTRTSGLIEFDGENFVQYEWTSRRAQTVTALLNDENRLLIGTFGGGLLEFDGTEFREIKADDKQIKAVNFLSKQGEKLYVGTFDNGLWIYEKDLWAHFTTAEGLNSNRIVGIAQQGKNLLVATDLGLAILEENRFRTIEILPAVSGLIQFDNRIFLTRETGEIYVFDKSLTEFAKNNDLTAARLTAADGKLFLLRSGGVFLFDDNKFVAFGNGGNRILTDNFISALAIDGRGNLWAGTFRRGVDILSGDGKLLTHLETEALREINFLQKNGETISAATTQGVFQFKSDFSYTTENLPIKTITHLSDGTAATAKGLVFTDEKTPKILTAVNRLPSNSVYTTLKIGDMLYAGTLSGLAQIENKRVVRVWHDTNSNLATNWVTSLAAANERIFIGTYGGGIFELLPSGEIKAFANEIGKFVVNPNALIADEKRLYAGTLEGAKVLDLQTQKWSNVKKILPSPTVMSVAVDEETIYFGTTSGIALVKKDFWEKDDENF